MDTSESLCYRLFFPEVTTTTTTRRREAFPSANKAAFDDFSLSFCSQSPWVSFSIPFLLYIYIYRFALFSSLSLLFSSLSLTLATRARKKSVSYKERSVSARTLKWFCSLSLSVQFDFIRGILVFFFIIPLRSVERNVNGHFTYFRPRFVNDRSYADAYTYIHCRRDILFRGERERENLS